MQRVDYLRRTMLSSALLALAHTAGCALPPEIGFSQRSDNLLHSLLQGETTPAEEASAEVATRTAKPYPTALKPGKAATPAPLQPQTSPQEPLPLQYAGAPKPRPLIPNELHGRIAPKFSDPLTTPTTTPSAPRPEQRASYSPVTESPWNSNAVATVVLEPGAPAQSEWPPPSAVDTIAAPLEIWNQYVSGPVAKPITKNEHLVAGLAERGRQLAAERAYHQQQMEGAPLQPFMPPTFTEPPSPSDQPASANQPIEKPAPEPLDHLLERLILALEEDIRQKTERKETDDLPALKQKLRLLQLIADRTDDAVDQIEQLPPAEREAFKQLMFALTTWLSPDDARRSSLRNAKILRSLQEVNNRLSAVSKLGLKNLMFCEKVESFGWYTEFPRAEFSPKQQVILYVEVQNFVAEEKTATSFETELAGSYQIFDTAGSIVDEHQLPLDRELCRNFRRDYFLAYRIHLPTDIQPGRYRLELTVEDLKGKKDFKGRKQGEAMIEFAIK